MADNRSFLTILTGSQAQLESLDNHPIRSHPNLDLNIDGLPYEDALRQYSLVIDLELDRYPERLKAYSRLEGAVVLGSAVERSLQEMRTALQDELWCKLFGLNSWPSMVNTTRWEVSTLDHDLEQHLKPSLPAEIEEQIEWEAVRDQVGMVRPRVLSMVINEAYQMWQEGAATREAIDNAMTYGTNYPYGPFAWSERIGVDRIYRTLFALGERYGTERFPISAALAEAYHEQAQVTFPA